MNLYKGIMDVMIDRRVVKKDLLMPYFICSIGCHMFNIMNRKKGVYMEGGLEADTRLHVLNITIPGFGKSYSLKQFLDKKSGLLKGTKIDHTFKASMSTAGLVGTIRSDKDGTPRITEGVAQRESNSIIGIHEFSEITNAMQQNFNAGLDTAFLTLLDDGSVSKDLGGGSLSYESRLTLWPAVQPARYELSGGMGRRFIYLVFIPSKKDIDDFRDNRRRGKMMKLDEELLSKVKKGIDDKFVEIKDCIEGVIFEDNFYKWLDGKRIIPYEEILYERMALGYTIMKTEKLTPIVRVGIDDELKRIMEMQIGFRRSVKRGIDKMQIWEFVKGCKEIEHEELVEYLLEFSLDEKFIKENLNTLVKVGLLIKEIRGSESWYRVKERR